MSFLPSSNRHAAPRVVSRDPKLRPAPELDWFIPEDATAPYDMMQAVKAVVDDREVFELHVGEVHHLLCQHSTPSPLFTK